MLLLNALILARDLVVLLGRERDCRGVKGIVELQAQWLLIVAVRCLFVESLCADEHIEHIKAL